MLCLSTVAHSLLSSCRLCVRVVQLRKNCYLITLNASSCRCWCQATELGCCLRGLHYIVCQITEDLVDRLPGGWSPCCSWWGDHGNWLLESSYRVRLLFAWTTLHRLPNHRRSRRSTAWRLIAMLLLMRWPWHAIALCLLSQAAIPVDSHANASFLGKSAYQQKSMGSARMLNQWDPITLKVP